MCRNTACFIFPRAAAASIICTNVTSRVIRTTLIIVPISAIGTEMATADSGSRFAARARATPKVPASPGSFGCAPPANIYAINGI